MRAPTTGTQAARFHDVLAQRLGLALEPAPAGLLDLLTRRAAGHDLSGAAYLDRLAAQEWPEEIDAVAEELTVTETYFYRHVAQFRAYAEVVLPERMRARAAHRRLSVVSVGCASGEEAYTLAMVTRDAPVDPSWEVSLLGVDVNRAMLRRARLGRYSPWSLRATPAEARRRWFRADGSVAVLDEAIRQAVRFVRSNLAEDAPWLWQPAVHDVIFCRNVLMYFTPDSARTAVARIVRSLAPGGFLFLGHAETLRGLSDDLDVCQTNDTFYYRRPVHARPAHASPARDRRPADRAPVRARTATAPRPAAPARGDPATDWDRALQLLREERFGQALTVVEGWPPGAGNSSDVAVLRAVLLAQSGHLRRAEEVCRALLEVDGLNAGAHYLLASCLESTGDREAAASHDQAAAYLDPSFAMPRLRLGVLARQQGDRAAARRELGRALALLAREDPQRLLLFGGGFTRDALTQLCRAELIACGGTP